MYNRKTNVRTNFQIISTDIHAVLHTNTHTHTHTWKHAHTTHTHMDAHTRTHTVLHSRSTHGVYTCKQYIRICLCTSQTPSESRGPACSQITYTLAQISSHNTKLSSQIINITIHLSKTSFSVIVSLSTL